MTSTNTLKTVALLAVLTALFMFVGYMLGRTTGMITALISPRSGIELGKFRTVNRPLHAVRKYVRQKLR